MNTIMAAVQKLVEYKKGESSKTKSLKVFKEINEEERRSSTKGRSQMGGDCGESQPTERRLQCFVCGGDHLTRDCLQ